MFNSYVSLPEGSYLQMPCPLFPHKASVDFPSPTLDFQRARTMFSMPQDVGMFSCFFKNHGKNPPGFNFSWEKHHLTGGSYGILAFQGANHMLSPGCAPDHQEHEETRAQPCGRNLGFGRKIIGDHRHSAPPKCHRPRIDCQLENPS